MPKPGKFKEIQFLELEDIQIPVEIHHEWRKSARVSIGRDKAIIRLPILIASSTKEEHMNWAKDWIAKKIKKDQNLKSSFFPKTYLTGTIIEVMGTNYTLQLNEKDGKTATGRRIDKTIYINLPSNLSANVRQKTCQKLIHRIMSQTYQHHVKKRVDDLNDTYFKKEINEIQLRNNSSNWGSCSSNKNISLSSRLLLAPAFVLDYIIIHELAHLVHHNHSAAYWKVVEKVMPNYMEAENWLKKSGSNINW
ncbi:MAG: DUF45 domain-containing protein [Saprospiraceae bacterium]|nr:DUF45 domain-containing protein [Saprospiraceae bacterium]